VFDGIADVGAVLPYAVKCKIPNRRDLAFRRSANEGNRTSTTVPSWMVTASSGLKTPSSYFAAMVINSVRNHCSDPPTTGEPRFIVARVSRCGQAGFCNIPQNQDRPSPWNRRQTSPMRRKGASAHHANPAAVRVCSGLSATYSLVVKMVAIEAQTFISQSVAAAPCTTCWGVDLSTTAMACAI